MATSRPSLGSRARYTSPMPPLASNETISYGPMRVPGVMAKLRAILAASPEAKQEKFLKGGGPKAQGSEQSFPLLDISKGADVGKRQRDAPLVLIAESGPAQFQGDPAAILVVRRLHRG